jgi:hypothetical protein
MGGYEEHASLPVVNLYLNHHPDQHELAFLPSNPDKMISTNDGGIFYCNDNTATQTLWTSLNNGYVTTDFYSCAIDHATTDDIIIGGAQDNGSWYTNSPVYTADWVTPRGGDGSYCAIADSSKAYYFSIQNGKMMRAKLDGSGNVDSFARIDPAGATGYLFINPYVLDPNDNNIMYLAAGKFLWRNSNLSGIPFRSNWDSITTNWFKFPDSITTSQATITAVTACKTPANRVYFGTNGRKMFRIDSANSGVHAIRNITPTSFPTSGGGSTASVSCIATDPNNGDHLMVSFSNYGIYSLFYSPDGGTTWQKVAGNLEDNRSTGAGDGPSIRWASIIPVDGGTVYLAGTSIGLFATTKLNDTNTVWVQQGANSIGAAIVDMIDYRATDGLVVVATHSNGIFSSHITEIGNITGVAQVTKTPLGFNLKNYPNPFSNQTTIQFDLQESIQVLLNVYDQMGRLVRTIANGPLSAGRQSFQFNGNNLANGMYYCVLQAGQHTETKQMMVIR